MLSQKWKWKCTMSQKWKYKNVAKVKVQNVTKVKVNVHNVTKVKVQKCRESESGHKTESAKACSLLWNKENINEMLAKEACYIS